MTMKRNVIEVAVLRQAGALQPYSTRQIVLALEDSAYTDLLEYDDRDVLNPASVNRALKRLAAAEPNLFKSPDAAEALDDGRYKGKPPGGSASSRPTLSKEEAALADMLAAVGITKNNAQK